ncbi:hypothetical protein CRI94_14160 [Longibacter salinarum]|uniref:Response regulatory domain-containing protein n=1 Tax=Longibacter salinarum TaxID=1850348 RepID=A0A2A8CVN8_9BACT|nr:response regulator transcription factor [Longibacter salinarum]PEN12654.1 hypothetical protein CRI94_14160 [Longibacter salinarum]
MPGTVLLADDHDVMRDILESFLQKKGYTVVASTNHGSNVVSLLEQHEPDLLILDLTMPGRNGLEVLKDLSSREYQTRIIVLTTHSEPAYVKVAFTRGADAYVIKGSHVRDLSAAIEKVENGERFLSASVQEAMQSTPTTSTARSTDEKQPRRNRAQ